MSHCRSLLILLLIGLVALIAVPAQMQEPSPTDTSFVYAWSSEVLYPEAVRFSIVVNLPASRIARATLTLERAGAASLELPISVAETAIFTDPYSELVYFWEIPQSAPLPLFTTVTYTWNVVSDRDEAANITDEFEFVDTRAVWTRSEDPEGQMHLTFPADSINAPTLRSSLRDIYALLAENTGQQPAFDLILYPDTLPYDPCTDNGQGRAVVVSARDGVSVPCSSGMLEAVLRASGLTPVILPPIINVNGNQETLGEFLVAAFYEPLWADADVPAWFQTGLALFYLPGVKTDFLLQVQIAARNDRLFSLQQLDMMPDDPALLPLWRAQSYGMVVYIAEQIGVPRLYRFANDLAAAESFSALYEQATGQPLRALLPAWRNWIFRDAAVSAFGFTPYQPDTPTPSPTRTPTPFPPTKTYTPTATPTYTPTPTVTGVLSATPLPSPTPLPTQPTSTPSLTPRPAGSLIETPTPLPTPQAQLTAVDPTLGIGIVGGIFLLLAVLSIIYLRTVNRNGGR